MKRHKTTSLYLIPVIAALFVMAACASIGRPEGGDYDVDPPVYVSSNPAPGETNFDNRRLTIDFDENVKVADVMDKVVVSPAQKSIPSVTANGRRVSVELKDTLLPSTTYTIDFSDAIRDLNEENVLDGYSLMFSTGPTIDTLRISGMVFQARNLEPAMGMLVGVYRLDSTDIAAENAVRESKEIKAAIEATKAAIAAAENAAEMAVVADSLVAVSDSITAVGDTLTDTVKTDSLIAVLKDLEARAAVADSIIIASADSISADSTVVPPIMSRPLERIAKTNGLGQFTILGLKPGDYRIFAVNDVNRDYHWDVSEDVAFYDVTLSPTVTDTEVTDSLTSVNGTDSVVTYINSSFYPNDVLLTWFNEGRMTQYLKDYSRNERNKLLIQFSTRADTLPEITLLNGEAAGKKIGDWAVMNTRAQRDSLDFFITDSSVIKQDTLMLAMKYLRTDTLNKISWGNDTLRVLFKGVRDEARRLEQAKKEEEKMLKKIEENPELEDSIRASYAPKPVYLDISLKSGSTQEIHRPAVFEFKQPLDSIDTSGLHLYALRDTISDTLVMPPFVQVDTFNLLNYKIDYKWEPGVKYTFVADSAAFRGIYNHNKEYKAEFTSRALEDYSALFFNITGVRDSATVEILDGNDKAVDSAKVVNGHAELPYLQPGTYYARLYIDRNGNGKYDTGNLLDRIQPEEVYYYPKKINLKKNWDVEESWNIYETPIDLQKPKEIVKNKPKETKRRRNKDGSYVDDRDENEEEEEDEYDLYDQNSNFFGPGNRNGTRNIGNNRSGAGGFRQTF